MSVYKPSSETFEITGTLINYFVHCRRQCWLAGNYITLEDESELVHIGKALHEEKLRNPETTELSVGRIKIDKISQDYVTEVKKSDADYEAVKWQLLYYLLVLEQKGIYRKGRIEFIEKNKSERKIYTLELDDEERKELEKMSREARALIAERIPPEAPRKALSKCIKCAYRGYCFA